MLGKKHSPFESYSKSNGYIPISASTRIDRTPLGVKPIVQSPAIDKAPSIPPYKSDGIQQWQEPISDQEGLKRARADGHTYVRGNTLYITGSRTGQDWYDNFTKIPKWQTINTIKDAGVNIAKGLGYEVPDVPSAPSDWGNLRDAERYKMAKEALQDNPQVTRVVGHSLGGSVALELQKEFPNLQSRTYGAPVFEPTGLERWQKGNVERFANMYDPVTIFDNSATRTNQTSSTNDKSAWFGHNYDAVSSTFKSGNPEMTRNLDGSYSLTA